MSSGRLVFSVLVCFSMIALVSGVSLADYEKGKKALDAGDFETALSEFRESAGQGNAGAQFNLGVMYYNGQGVQQDYIQAHKWLNLAGAGGYAPGRDTRDKLETRMTPAQIAEAQELVREWKPKTSGQ